MENGFKLLLPLGGFRFMAMTFLNNYLLIVFDAKFNFCSLMPTRKPLGPRVTHPVSVVISPWSGCWLLNVGFVCACENALRCPFGCVCLWKCIEMFGLHTLYMNVYFRRKFIWKMISRQHYLTTNYSICTFSFTIFLPSIPPFLPPSLHPFLFFFSFFQNNALQCHRSWFDLEA